jgi:predicted membrane protein (TIGR00267 family)
MEENRQSKLKGLIQRIAVYNKVANIPHISRRYFALNGFDGVITIIGVLLGNYIVGTTEYKHVIIAGMAVCISLLVSGVWSAYNSESAERAKELKDLEMTTLHELDGTVISRAQRFATIILSAVNGLSSGVTAFIPLIPFFFGKFIPINVCYYIGFALAFLILTGIGIFLGRISRRNVFISILKMIIAGVFVVLLGYLLTLIE